MVKAIDRKVVRDLLQLKGQVLTIALVVASGVAVFVGLRSTYDSLVYSRDAYYERYRFPDVFAHLERAPEALRARIEEIPGVASVETRVVENVRVPMPGIQQPPIGVISSLPNDGQPSLLGLHLTDGRLPEPLATGEAVLLDHFARRHGIRPGQQLTVIVNGKLRAIRIVGIALSPEFVYPITAAGGVIPDDSRLAVLWMLRSEIAPTFQLDGAFNDVVLRLQAGASPRAVIEALDRLLEPHGGLGAVDRELQISNYVVSGELVQLEGMATSLPAIFLFVAAFLLNVVLTRLVYLQRAQIAALKAVGYSNMEVGIHFLKLTSVMVVLGAMVGLGAGHWFGRAVFGLYEEYFRFPIQVFRVDLGLAVSAVAVSLVAGFGGAMMAVRRAVLLPPAEAMRPASPLTYRRTLLERLGLHRLFSQSTRMIFRELERRPLRTLLSVLGLSMAVATVMVGRFNVDAIDMFMHIFFEQNWREDLSVAFADAVPLSERQALAAVPGVLTVEPMRMAGVRIHSGPRHRDIALYGYADGAELRRVVDGEGHPRPLPADGLLLTEKLGEILQVRIGDRVELELRERDRGRRGATVAGFIDELGGLQAHARLEVVSRLLREDPRMSLALLTVDPAQSGAVIDRLTEIPKVFDVSSRLAIIGRFRKQSAESVWVMTLFATIFAAIIAVGVVYNNARVALSMRERELASLRVLGFTRGEISTILLGEMAIQILLAIPPGFWAGVKLCQMVASTVDPERFRFPVVISAQTYAFAAAVTLISGLVSALLVRRKLDHLDLIGVLKTRE
ncbi:MAG: ABC transporter permease [Deltaproteobacteria bacterium]|nr:ABC transporter permease [Deltaproteobacteria bacterium]